MCIRDSIEKAKRTGKKLVGVVMSGRPLALETVEPYLDAIVWAWQNGTEGAAAAAAVLYGDVNPSGKLSMTLPRVIGPVSYTHLAVPIEPRSHGNSTVPRNETT